MERDDVIKVVRDILSQPKDQHPHSKIVDLIMRVQSECDEIRDYVNRLEDRIEYRLGTHYLLSLQGDVEPKP